MVWCPEGAEMGDFYFNPGEAEASEGEVMTPGTCVNEAVFYYTCEKCGAIESDRNHIFKGEINPENHNPSDIWESDYSGHWHECKDCKEKLDFAHLFQIGFLR